MYAQWHASNPASLHTNMYARTHKHLFLFLIFNCYIYSTKWPYVHVMLRNSGNDYGHVLPVVFGECGFYMLIWGRMLAPQTRYWAIVLLHICWLALLLSWSVTCLHVCLALPLRHLPLVCEKASMHIWNMKGFWCVALLKHVLTCFHAGMTIKLEVG